jgi:hypothetical protein
VWRVQKETKSREKREELENIRLSGNVAGKGIGLSAPQSWARGKAERADLDRRCELTSTTLFPSYSYDKSLNLYIKSYCTLYYLEPLFYPALIYQIRYRKAKESLEIGKICRSSTTSTHPTSLGPKGPKSSQKLVFPNTHQHV